MRVIRFQWPDDLAPAARSMADRVEVEARQYAANRELGAGGLDELAEYLIDGVGRLGSLLGGAIRVITDYDQDDEGNRGARVRFTWTRSELEHRTRQAEIRSRAAAEAERQAQRSRGNRDHLADAARYVQRDQIPPSVAPISPSTLSPEGQATYTRLRDQYRARAGGADRRPAAPLSAAEIRDREATFAATLAVDMGAALDMVAEAQARALFSEGAIAAEELASLSNTPARGEAWPTPPGIRELADRIVATAGDDLRPGDMVSIGADGLARRAQAGPSYGLASGVALENLPTLDGEDRDYRREVLGEFVDFAPRGRDAMTREQWGSDRRSVDGICEICEADETMWCDQVVHRDPKAARRVASAIEWRRQYPRAEVELARADAVDRLLRIMLAIAVAAERTRVGFGTFMRITTTILRAWSSAPLLLELDGEHAPFGVDLEPPADPITVRAGLLEL